VRKLIALPAAVLAVVSAIFVIAFFTTSNELLLINMMVYLILAEGLNILYGFTGYMPFGYVGFVGAGAYGFSLTVLLLHWPPLVAVCLGGVAAVLFALILAPLLRLRGAYFAISTLAAALAAFEVVANPHLTSITQGPYGISLADVYAPATSYWALLGILVFTIIVVSCLRLSRFGLALQAIRDNPGSAAMAGVNVLWGRVASWLLSAFVAGLAGAGFAWNISVFYPQTVFSLTISVFAIVFALFGGVGTVIGPLAGAAILYGLYNYIGVTNPQYFQLIYGILIVVLILFLPGGLAALVSKRVKRVF
jgi:branched-chain amino acid transport system permease protein